MTYLKTCRCSEFYSNHLGTTDNFLSLATGGTGSGTPDTTNHELDIATGTTDGSYVWYRSKDTWAASVKPLIANIILSAKPTLAGGNNTEMVAGFTDNSKPAKTGSALAACFSICSYPGGAETQALTNDGTSVTRTGISFSANDLLTVILTPLKAIFLVNGIIVATHTTNIPSGNVHLQSSLRISGESVNRTMSVDMMSVSKCA